MVGTLCFYCDFEITPGDELYTARGDPAHWQCAAFNDRWERRIRNQETAEAVLPDGIAQQIIEAWERELNESGYFAMG